MLIKIRLLLFFNCYSGINKDYFVIFVEVDKRAKALIDAYKSPNNKLNYFNFI